MKPEEIPPPAEIKIISAKDTYPIRQEVLRNGKPLSSCIFEGDESKHTFHLGVFRNEKLMGVASFLKNKNPNFKKENQYQLRGMAVLPGFQNQKIGEKLLLHGEDHLKQQKQEILLWFNAREGAVNFYTKHGYLILGTSFEIKGVGTHFLMYKTL